MISDKVYKSHRYSERTKVTYPYCTGTKLYQLVYVNKVFASTYVLP